MEEFGNSRHNNRIDQIELRASEQLPGKSRKKSAELDLQLVGEEGKFSCPTAGTLSPLTTMLPKKLANMPFWVTLFTRGVHLSS
jgi:hypothetical protein